MNVAWQHSAAAGERWTDAAFPAGRDLLDPAHVARAVGCLPPPVAAPGGARLLDVYYYPGRALQAVHRLADGSVVTVEGLPFGRTPADGERAAPQLGAVVRPFPRDPGLPSLPAVLAQARPHPDLLTYLPGRRCVLGTADRVAKLSTASAVARSHERQLALWNAPDRRFRMARPLLLDVGRAVRWERRLPGDRIDTRLPGLRGTTVAKLVGPELVALHSLSADALGLAQTGPAQLLARLERKTLRTLERALPGAVTAQARDAVALLRAAGPPPCGPPVPVHGDCHLANLLLDGEGVTLLDLDEMALGDPELDLAQFATRALLVALHGGSGLDAAVSLAVHLPEAYTAAGGRVVQAPAYAWYFAGCLLSHQIRTCVRHLAPDLERLVQRLVTIAEVVLRRGVVDEHLLVPAAA